jgi:signal transduction histidine kinase
VGDIRLLCRAALNLIKNAEAHAVARVCVSCGEGRHPPRGRPLLTPARPLSALSGERGGRTHQAQPHERHQARHQAQPHERHQAQPHERWVWLTVEDDGPGVPAEERGRIFDPFVRLESSRSRAQGGAGLGLSIVQGVAAAHSGVVWVDESPLGGARFTLAFPTPLPEREQGGEQGGERGATSLATPL